jgi:hypothetical protein
MISNLRQDAPIDFNRILPKDLGTVKYKGSIAETVDETVCGPLSKQWERYAKKNGLVNEAGEPTIRIDCKAVESPAPAPR